MEDTGGRGGSNIKGVEAGAPAGMAGGRRGQAPGQPSPASSSRTGTANTLCSHPLCSSTAGIGTGIWQLRPRRTYRAGTRAWPPASAPSPPAPWVAQAGPRPSIQGLAGGPPLKPCEGGTPQGLSSTTQLHGRHPPRRTEETPDGHFLPNLLFFCFQPPVCRRGKPSMAEMRL